MPTSAERQALVFVAALAVVGAGVRVASAHRFAAVVSEAAGAVRTDSGSPAARALEAQIAAVDSARANAPKRGRRGAGERSTRGQGARRKVRSSGADDRPTPKAESVTPDQPIDINSATAAELEALPRVGPALAKRMIDWRNAHGPFTSEEDLRHVAGIGVTTAALISPLVTFSAGYRPFQSETRPSRRYPDSPAI